MNLTSLGSYKECWEISLSLSTPVSPLAHLAPDWDQSMPYLDMTPLESAILFRQAKLVVVFIIGKTSFGRTIWTKNPYEWNAPAFQKAGSVKLWWENRDYLLEEVTCTTTGKTCVCHFIRSGLTWLKRGRFWIIKLCSKLLNYSFVVTCASKSVCSTSCSTFLLVFERLAFDPLGRERNFMLVGKNILSLLPTKASFVGDYFSHW